MILIQDAVAEGDVIICILAERPNEERKIHHDRRHAPVGAIRCLCGMKDTSGSGNDGPAKAPTGIPILAGIQGMLPAHPRAAFRAEVGSDSTPQLSGSAVCLGRAFDLHATPGKVSVHGIGASGAPLANLAVTHGDDVRIALYVQSVGPQMGAQCLQARGLPGNLSRAHAAIVSTSGARGAPKHGSALLLSEAHRTGTTGAKKPIPRYAAAQLWWPRPRWWLTRFTNRRQLMAFSELFASEHISGGTRLRITKAGNEVAHVDQFRPRCRLYSVRHRGYGLFRLAKSSRQPGDTDHATPASHRRVAARLAP